MRRPQVNYVHGIYVRHNRHLCCSQKNLLGSLFNVRKRSCGKVMLSQAFVCTRRGGGGSLSRRLGLPPVLSVYWSLPVSGA